MSAQQKCVERIFVGGAQPWKKGLGNTIQCVVSAFELFEDARRQHGRQGKSHKGGNDYGSGNDDTELPKQASGNPLQKHNGKEHRRQRNGGGNYRKENFGCSFNTGLLRVHPLLYFGVNVLHNHNGVVHYQTNGQYYGQKGEDVDGKAGHIHYKEGTDERYGYGKGGNERGTPVAQKHKNNEHHQGKGQIDGLLHLGDGVAYVLGIVEAHFGNNVGGQILFQLFETQQGVVHNGNVVGSGLGHQHIVDHGHPVHFKNTVHILRLYNGAAQIPKTDHAVAVLVHHHAVEILHRGKTPHGTYGKFRITAFNTSGRQFYIFTRKCGTHIHRRQLISSQFGRIHPQAYGKAFGAPGADLTHTLYGLETLLKSYFSILGQVDEGTTAAAQSYGENRLGIGVGLGHHRRIGIGGQAPHGARDFIAHVVGSGLQIHFQVKFYGNATGAIATAAADASNALNAVNGLLQGLGNLGLNNIGIGPGKTGRNRYKGLVDTWIIAYAQVAETDEANDDDKNIHHYGQNGTPYAEGGYAHILMLVNNWKKPMRGLTAEALNGDGHAGSQLQNPAGNNGISCSQSLSYSHHGFGATASTYVNQIGLAVAVNKNLVAIHLGNNRLTGHLQYVVVATDDDAQIGKHTRKQAVVFVGIQGA